MLSYPWPGNVRELSHVIERAVLWSQGPTLDVEHLSLSAPEGGYPNEVPAVSEPDRAGVPNEATAIAPALPAPGIDLSQWEKSLIEQALREADGNQTRAAQRLGISRDTLRYRLKKFGLQG
jgi:DNA-binding NtrC family response regulator